MIIWGESLGKNIYQQTNKLSMCMNLNLELNMSMNCSILFVEWISCNAYGEADAVH